MSMSIPAEMDFEAALAEIEQIVAALERGGPDLKEALAGYGRGIALLAACQGILDTAERSVALLTGVDDAGEPVTAPFDATATATAAPPVEPVAAVPVAPPRKSRAAAPPGPPTPPAPPVPPATIPEAPF